MTKGLTSKQKRFCEEYVIDWNATRAAIAAGYSDRTAGQTGHENLKKPEIQSYIEKIQKDLSKLCGLSAAKNLLELKKLAFTSISQFKEDWGTDKSFEDLTEDQRAAISEITHITKAGKSGQATIVKFKLHDKLKSLDMINKMLGWYAPEKHDLTTKGDKIGEQDYSNLTDEETGQLAYLQAKAMKGNAQ